MRDMHMTIDEGSGPTAGGGALCRVDVGIVSVGARRPGDPRHRQSDDFIDRASRSWHRPSADPGVNTNTMNRRRCGRSVGGVGVDPPPVEGQWCSGSAPITVCTPPASSCSYYRSGLAGSLENPVSPSAPPPPEVMAKSEHLMSAQPRRPTATSGRPTAFSLRRRWYLV